MPSAMISWQDLVHVVAREAEGGLSEIVGAEGEELGLFGDFVRHQRRPRQLDHGADQVIDCSSLFL